MNRLITALFLLTLCFSALAKDTFKSGDKQVDRWLVNINFVARDNWLEAIKSQAQSFNVKEERLIETYEILELSPADFYVALSIQQITGEKWDDIVDRMMKYQASGVAKVLEVSGIPTHSKEFNQFKKLIQQGAPERDLEAEHNNIFFNSEKKK